MMDPVIENAKEKMEKALSHLKDEYAKLQTGRASAALVEGVVVESYGSMMPLKGIASISIPESNQIAIQPWDRTQLSAIEKAITVANLGLNPQNDGLVIRLILPPLTQERRKDIVKTVHRLAEEARISVRNARHEALTRLKAEKLSEDELAGREDQLQKEVDSFNKKVEELAKHKETDVMTV